MEGNLARSCPYISWYQWSFCASVVIETGVPTLVRATRTIHPQIPAFERGDPRARRASCASFSQCSFSISRTNHGNLLDGAVRRCIAMTFRKIPVLRQLALVGHSNVIYDSCLLVLFLARLDQPLLWSGVYGCSCFRWRWFKVEARIYMYYLEYARVYVKR